MPVILARLARSLPIALALLVAAGIIYVVAAWRTSPNRAKLILIRGCTILCLGVVVFFLVAAAYALIDNNPIAAEIALTFALPGVIGLVITFVCRSIFLKHHPQYAQTPVRAEYIDQRPWMRFIQWILGR